MLTSLSLLSLPISASVNDEAEALVEDYISAWKAFYPSRAFAYGDADSSGVFENFAGDRVPAWLELNARTARQAQALLDDAELNEAALDIETRTNLLVLHGQAVDEQASWREDEPLTRQPQWYAGQVSQALTHLLVRDQLSAAARQQALFARLNGVTALCQLGVEQLTGGNALQTQRAIRTLAGTRSFYATDLPALIERWNEETNAAPNPATAQAINQAVEAITALEARLDALLPSLPEDPAMGADLYTAKLARRIGPELTPDQLLASALEEMRLVRELMVAESWRWYQNLDSADPATGENPELSDEEVLTLALEAMEAARVSNQADFLAQFEFLTAASERFVVENAIATVPTPTTLYVALSPAHFSGAAVGGVYPSGPFDPQADTLFYIPSVPDDAPQEARDGFYRSFNDHFNAMIIPHEMFPGHYLQYKVAVSEAPPIRSLFSNGAYTEGWGSFVEELLLDAGWADNAPLTRLAHLRKRLENATRATVSVQVHTAGWDREQVLEFAREEGLLAPQFAENLWQRVVNSPLQITTYFVGWTQFQELFAARPEGPLMPWVDGVLRAGPVPMNLLPPLLAR